MNDKLHLLKVYIYVVQYMNRKILFPIYGFKSKLFPLLLYHCIFYIQNGKNIEIHIYK